MDKNIDVKQLAKIESYINGSLSEMEIDELWTEFLKNPQLHDYFITELHFQNLRRKGGISMDTNRAAGDGTEEQYRQYSVWKYAAAAIILLVAALQFFRFDDLSEQGLAMLSISSIEHSELAGANIYRSSEYTGSQTDVVINEGLAHAYGNNVSLALETFRDLLIRELSTEQNIRIHINLGILLYNEGNYHQAGDHFLSVTEMETSEEEVLIEKGWWFLGHSLLRTGDADGAGNAFLHVSNLNGRFQMEAAEMLDKLENYHQ